MTQKKGGASLTFLNHAQSPSPHLRAMLCPLSGILATIIPRAPSHPLPECLLLREVFPDHPGTSMIHTPWPPRVFLMALITICTTCLFIPSPLPEYKFHEDRDLIIFFSANPSI